MPWTIEQKIKFRNKPMHRYLSGYDKVDIEVQAHLTSEINGAFYKK